MLLVARTDPRRASSRATSPLQTGTRFRPEGHIKWPVAAGWGCWTDAFRLFQFPVCDARSMSPRLRIRRRGACYKQGPAPPRRRSLAARAAFFAMTEAADPQDQVGPI